MLHVVKIDYEKSRNEKHKRDATFVDLVIVDL
jgi:hypothetical protein